MIKFLFLCSFFTAAFAGKVYKDVFSHDVMFTDANEIKLVDDILYEVHGKMIPIKVEGKERSAVDVIYNNKLQEVAFPEKRDYIDYMKEYMVRIVEKLRKDSPDEIDVFGKNIRNVIKEFVGRYENLRFFTGESEDTDAMIAVQEYKDPVDGEQNRPVLYFFKHGLEEVIV